MSNRVNAKYKVSRRLGVNVWGRDKDPYNKKNYPPGQHGVTGRRLASDYGKQLIAKQRLKAHYANINERQFRRIFKEATRLKGDAGQNLLGLLERRLDITIFRLNFAPTIFAARQLISHKHIKVNGKAVNVPSYRLKEGDVIEVKDKAKKMPIIVEAIESLERDVPAYLELHPANAQGKYIRVPALDEIPYPFEVDPNRIIEYYSR